jgi:hypothetical protein
MTNAGTWHESSLPYPPALRPSELALPQPTCAGPQQFFSLADQIDPDVNDSQVAGGDLAWRYVSLRHPYGYDAGLSAPHHLRPDSSGIPVN